MNILPKFLYIFQCLLVLNGLLVQYTKYYILITWTWTNLDRLKNNWETDLNEPITDDTWHKIIQGIFSSSICLKHAVIQFKIVHRLHWSKVRLSKIKADIDPTCDRCRQDPATLLHMFWTCPKLCTFWQSIFETFSKIFGKGLAPSPFIALFGVAQMGSHLEMWERTILAFCSLLARKLILLKCKDPTPSTYSHWIREVIPYKVREDQIHNQDVY